MHHDAVIIGAGMVGSTLASLLAASGFSVALVEAAEPQPFKEGQDIGLRVSAISPGSASILEQAGAWRQACEHRSRPYRRMQVEDGGGGDPLIFDAPVYNLERLGTIIENDLLQWSLWQRIRTQGQVDVYCPDAFAASERRADHSRVTLKSGKVLTARLLVGADGAASLVRRAVGIRQDSWAYNQKGLVAVVKKTRANPGVAWQRFMPGGPLAFLPLTDGRSSIVWTRPATEAEQLLKLERDAFMAALDTASKGWLGTVSGCGPRAAFPLSMRLSECYASRGTVLIGDAAHVVHPLAGQGVNLGLADAAALVESMVRTRGSSAGFGSEAVLQKYDRWRRSESRLMSFGMHALHHLFNSDVGMGLRRAGLAVVRRSWLLQDQFVRRAAGLGANAPRLATGEKLRSL